MLLKRGLEIGSANMIKPGIYLNGLPTTIVIVLVTHE